MPRPILITRLLPGLALSLLAACAGAPPKAVDALPADASATTTEVARMKDGFDALDPAVARHVKVTVAEQPLVTGLGFAQVAGQPGKTLNERRLMALRAARLEAMRDLTEQVHGLRLSSETTLQDAVTVNDTLRATVAGSIRGARTVRITPKGDDTYEVLLALDKDTVGYILRAAGQS